MRTDEEIVIDCERAILNGNCPDHCDACPIGKDWIAKSEIPEEDMERAEAEHRFGVDAP